MARNGCSVTLLGLWHDYITKKWSKGIHKFLDLWEKGLCV